MEGVLCIFLQFQLKTLEQIKADNPELEAFDTYDELLAAIKKAL